MLEVEPCGPWVWQNNPHHIIHDECLEFEHLGHAKNSPPKVWPWFTWKGWVSTSRSFLFQKNWFSGEPVVKLLVVVVFRDFCLEFLLGIWYHSQSSLPWGVSGIPSHLDSDKPEADEEPGCETGNLLVVLHEEAKKTFSFHWMMERFFFVQKVEISFRTCRCSIKVAFFRVEKSWRCVDEEQWNF